MIKLQLTPQGHIAQEGIYFPQDTTLSFNDEDKAFAEGIVKETLDEWVQDVIVINDRYVFPKDTLFLTASFRWMSFESDVTKPVQVVAATEDGFFTLHTIRHLRLNTPTVVSQYRVEPYFCPPPPRSPGR